MPHLGRVVWMNPGPCKERLGSQVELAAPSSAEAHVMTKRIVVQNGEPSYCSAPSRLGRTSSAQVLSVTNRWVWQHPRKRRGTGQTSRPIIQWERTCVPRGSLLAFLWFAASFPSGPTTICTQQRPSRHVKMTALRGGWRRGETSFILPGARAPRCCTCALCRRRSLTPPGTRRPAAGRGRSAASRQRRSHVCRRGVLAAKVLFHSVPLRTTVQSSLWASAAAQSCVGPSPAFSARGLREAGAEEEGWAMTLRGFILRLETDARCVGPS